MKISLTKQEAEILKEAAKAERMENLLLLQPTNDRKVSLAGTDDTFCDLHECCGRYLMMVGFDEGYNITEKGRLLESLIDKFYDSLEEKNNREN